MGSKRTLRRKRFSQRGGSIYNDINDVLSKYNGEENGVYKLNETNLTSFLLEINNAIQGSKLTDPIFGMFKQYDSNSDITIVRKLIIDTMEYIEEKELEDPASLVLNRNIDMSDFNSSEFNDLIKKFNGYLYANKPSKDEAVSLLDQIKAYLKKIPEKYLTDYPVIRDNIYTVKYYDGRMLKLIDLHLQKLATKLRSINTDLVISWGRPSEHSNSSASNSAYSTSSPQPLATIPEAEDTPQTRSASETATKTSSFVSIPTGGSRKRKRKLRRNTRTKRRRRRQVKT